MGYRMRQMDGSFFIPKDQLVDSLESLRREISGNAAVWSEYVNVEDFKKSETLEDAMNLLGWKTYQTEDGSLNGLHFFGEYYREDFRIFQALSPYARTHSWIIMKGESGDLWRWLIRDGKCIEQAAKIYFED